MLSKWWQIPAQLQGTKDLFFISYWSILLQRIAPTTQIHRQCNAIDTFSQYLGLVFAGTLHVAPIWYVIRNILVVLIVVEFWYGRWREQ